MQQILQDLNEDFFLDNSLNIEKQIEWGRVDEKAVTDKWIGFPPASEQEISLKEKQLGVSLPPSYKRFLLASNGFRNISTFMYRLLSLEKVDWAKNIEEQWLLNGFLEHSYEVSDEEYFNYSDEQDTVFCRTEYILESLKVSEWGDSMCVYLNPIVKHGEEWEVLEYAHWYPGIKRYKSFEEFLFMKHEMNVWLRNDAGA